MSLDFQEWTITRNGRSFRVLATSALDDLAELEWLPFIGHRKVTGDDFLKAIKWAESFPIGHSVLLTPYHSPLEKEVSRIILRKGGRIIIVLARAPLKRTPVELREELKEGQLVFLSTPELTNPRPTRDRCLERNELIMSMA
jgi:hypothetical protein